MQALAASLAELRALEVDAGSEELATLTALTALTAAVELMLDPVRTASAAVLAPRVGLVLATCHSLYDCANPAHISRTAIRTTGAVLAHTLTVELSRKLGPRGVGWLPGEEHLGAPWVQCAVKIFNGIAVHCEQSEQLVRESRLSARDLPHRKNLATLLPLLTAIVAPPSHPRAIVSPPAIKYLALDLITEIITSHKANKDLLRAIADMDFFGELLFDSTDRLLATPALEIAYRLLPDAQPSSAKGKEKARLGDGPRQAAMRALFPKERFGLDAKPLVDMLGGGTSVAFFKTSKMILDHLSLATITRAQPFAALELLHDSAPLAPPPSASHPTETQPRRSSQSQTCIDFWLGRDALAALVGTAENGRTVGLSLDAEVDEEARYWFMLEHVEKVELDSRPAADELLATFHLSRPALLAFEPLFTFETGKPPPTVHRVVLVLCGAGGENLRVLKKTLLDRAKRYPKLHPILQTDGVVPDPTKLLSHPPTARPAPPPKRPSTAGRILPPPLVSLPRKSSQAGPVAAIDQDSSPEQQEVSSKESQLDERRGALQSIAEMSQSPTSSILGNLEDSVPASDEIEDADDESGGDKMPFGKPFDLTSTRIALVKPNSTRGVPAESVASAEEDEPLGLFVADTPRVDVAALVAEDAPPMNDAIDAEQNSSGLSDPDYPASVGQKAANPVIVTAAQSSELESPISQSPSPNPNPPRSFAPESSILAPLPAPLEAVVDSPKVPNARARARPPQPRSLAVEVTRTTRARAAKLAEAQPAAEVGDAEDERIPEAEADAVPDNATKKRRSTSPPPSASEQDEIDISKVSGKGKGQASTSTKKKARVEFVDAPAYPKRGKLSDPSPLDPDAATATTLDETDKSSGPYTFDQPRLLVAPKRKYGKQRKSIATNGAGTNSKRDAAVESDAEATDYEEHHEAPSVKRALAKGVKRKTRVSKDDPASQEASSDYDSHATVKAPKGKGKTVKAPSLVASENLDHTSSPEVTKDVTKRKGRSSNAAPAPAPPKVDKPAPAVVASPPKAKKPIQTFAQLHAASPRRHSPPPPKPDSPNLPVREAEFADDFINDEHDYGMRLDSPALDRTLSQLGDGDPSSPSSLRTELLDPALDPTFVDRALVGDKAKPEKDRSIVKEVATPTPFKTGPSPRKDEQAEAAPVAAEAVIDEMEVDAPVAETLVSQADEELQELLDQLVQPPVVKECQPSPAHALKGVKVKVSAHTVEREASLKQIEQVEVEPEPAHQPGVQYLGNHALGPAVEQDEDEDEPMGSASEPDEPERKFLDSLDSAAVVLPAIEQQQQQEPLEFDLVQQEGDIGSGASNAGDDEAEGDEQAPMPWQAKRDPTPTPTPTPTPSPSPSPQPKFFTRQPAHKSLAPMRSILTRRPTAGPSRAALPAPPTAQLPSNSPPAKSPFLFPRHTANFQLPITTNDAHARVQPRASTSGTKPITAAATAATAAEPRKEQTRPKEKTKKRRSHRPAKDPAPVPHDDEMQEIADALQGVMDQVLKQHQSRRSAAAASFARSCAVIDRAARKVTKSLLKDSANLLEAAHKSLEWPEKTARLEEVVATHRAKVATAREERAKA